MFLGFEGPIFIGCDCVCKQSRRYRQLWSEFEWFLFVDIRSSHRPLVYFPDWVFLATPPKPEITEATYRPLNFRSDQTVVSLIAGLAPALLAELCAPVPKTEIVQAFPLPPAEHQASTTVMCPRHAAAEALFDMVGKTVAVDSYEQAISIGVMSCTMGA